MRLSRSIIGKKEQEAVLSVLEQGFLGMGPETQAFEQELANFLGDKTLQVVCVNTGTSALQLALQACGLGMNDEVLVPSLTYVASFQAISATGATPVPCDIEASSALLDITDAEQRLTPRTKAIMPVHYASAVGNLDALYNFAQYHNLRVVEDAAHAFGCTYKEKRIGTLGDIICFSFDGIKNITSGEGGAVISSDSQVIQHVQDARLLGVKKDTEKRYQGQRSWEFDVTEQGWRYHMSDIMAAIGRVQLRRFEKEFKPKRIALAKRYRVLLENRSGIALLDTDLGSIVPHIQPIRVLDGKRNLVRQKLIDVGIGTGLHYKPNHLLTKYGNGQVSLPVTEQFYTELLTLPLHPNLSISDVDTIVDIVVDTINNGTKDI